MNSLLKFPPKTLGAKKHDLFMTDFDQLQTSTSEVKFDEGYLLFKAKWKVEDAGFMQYFENEWVKQHKYWFTGSSEPGMPSTNNGVESCNSTIKRDFSHRERLQPKPFFNMLSNVVSYFSKKYRVPNAIVAKPPIFKKIYENASKRILSGPSFEEERFNYFKVAAGHFNDLEEAEIASLLVPNTFEEHVESTNALYFCNFGENLNLEEASCTCIYFSKKNICKHIIGILAIKDVIKIPDELCCKPLPLGQRKRGRKPKVGSAYFRDRF